MERVITVPNKEWFDKNNAHWEGDERLWIVGYGIFYLENNKYPKHFQREAPWDYHDAPTWHEVNKDARVRYIKDELQRAKDEVRMLEAQLKETEKK